MTRYGYFDDFDEIKVTVSTTFDRKQFGELELIGTAMQYKTTGKSFWGRIGVGGSVTTAPVFWKGLMFFGACDRNFYCLDVDGKERWRFRTNGIILCDAAVHEGMVFFGSGDHNMYALDCQTGKVIWKCPTGGPVLSYAAVYKGLVFMGSYDANIYAADEKSGKEIIRIPTVGEQIGAVEKDGVLYFGYGGGVFYAYDIEKRRMLWTFKAQKRITGWGVSFWGNVLYIGSFEGNVYALDRRNGSVLWKFGVSDATYLPTVSGNRVFFGSRDFNAYCLDAETGKLIWKFRAGNFVTWVFEADGRVYFSSWDGNVYCMHPETGKEIWRFRTNGFLTNVSFHDNRVYFGCWDCHMYCLDAGTGKLIWKFRTSLGTPSPIEPPETGMVRSAEIVWKAPEQEKAREKKGEQQISDYADTKGVYAGAGMGDYLGKKKRGYV